MKNLITLIRELLDENNNLKSGLYLKAITESEICNLITKNKLILSENISVAMTAESLTLQCTQLQYFLVLRAEDKDIIHENYNTARLRKAEMVKVFNLYKLLCKYGANLNLTGASLRGAQLQFANLSGAILENCDLQGADLFQANLKDADLTGANLQGANLSEANLFGTNLTNTDLRRVNLSQAELRNSKMVGTAIRGAELWSANMWKVDISKSFYKGADLTRADIRGS